MHYTIYQITNLVNGKLYIGAHKTKDLEDGYMGSGKILLQAIEKYGIGNFKKEILEVFESSEEMFDMESKIVNESYILRKDTYNIRLGGFGGFDHINKRKDKTYIDIRRKNGKLTGSNNIKKCHEAQNELSPEQEQAQNARRVATMRKKSLSLYGDDKEIFRSFKDKRHTTETKKKMSNAKKGTCTGDANSQFGTMWIYNLELRKSKKISKDAELPAGWLVGRKIKF